jgi:DNA-damage-inducible protein J
VKTAVVRARIDESLKQEASSVLEANGIEISDAIRLFLRQVVARGGLPFAPRLRGRVKAVSAKSLRRMKHQAQERDRALTAAGHFSKGELFLISPEAAQRSEVKWPEGSLRD